MDYSDFSGIFNLYPKNAIVAPIREKWRNRGNVIGKIFKNGSALLDTSIIGKLPVPL
jgi:hypothetical protein